MKTFTTHSDERGYLVLPPEVTQQLGLIPDAEVTIEDNEYSLSIARPITLLERV